MEILFSPQWFYNIDSAFEVVSVVVTAAIALYSLKIYYFTKDNRQKYFGLSFLAISLSYLAKIMTNVVVYRTVQETGPIITITKVVLGTIPLLTVTGLFMHRILMLAGLSGIYLLLSNCREKNRAVVIAYFILVTTLFSGYAYFVFHMTAALFLMYIVLFYHDREGKKHCNAITLAFGFLLLSQIAFVFIFLGAEIYVVGEVLQLLGFIILLYKYYKLVIKR